MKAGRWCALAYAALAQSPAVTIAGAVSIDPATTLETTVPLCPGAPATAVDGRGFRYGAPPRLPGWWHVASRHPIPAALAPLVTTDGGESAQPGASTNDPAQRLVIVLTGAVFRNGDFLTRASIGHLPLTEIPSETAGPLMAIIYSGDGGWRDLDKQIGEHLAQHGVPVVGVDSLRYFWRRKTAEKTASDLASIIEHYTAIWKTPGVALVGYSFGDYAALAERILKGAPRRSTRRTTTGGMRRDEPPAVS